MKERILVIKLGALGDLVLCSASFAAIRAHHPDAEIALLTGPAFAGFGRQMPWFDTVLCDPRPKVTQLRKWFDLIRAVRAFAPTRVYDFQGKPRQSILYYALGKPQWSGAVKGCSHPRLWPPVKGMHYTDFLAAQLKAAGIVQSGSLSKGPNTGCHCESSHLGGRGNPSPELSTVGACQDCAMDRHGPEGFYDDSSFLIPDLSWLDGPLEDLGLPEKFALLITGCSPQHPHKKWPVAYFAALAVKLAEKGIASIAIGTKADAYGIAEVQALAPDVVDLSGQTSLGQVAALARRAEIVVGNDTGPTHLAAAVGGKTIALMSERVDPLWSSPRGPHTQWLGGKPMSEISVDEVLAAVGI
ncbi:MAG: glycosyltransferase family 9 protein [Alphaproteobacteria bacterium]|nr:glycosyltransferase family 9 protein [Alphaproteobacteria bacterium]